MLGFVVLLAVGLCLCAIGFYTLKTGNPRLIHSYHHTRVAQADMPRYTRLMGAALAVMGAGTVLTGVISLAAHSGAGWAVFALSFAGGLGLIFYTQKKYNGGLFS